MLLSKKRTKTESPSRESLFWKIWKSVFLLLLNELLRVIVFRLACNSYYQESCASRLLRNNSMDDFLGRKTIPEELHRVEFLWNSALLAMVDLSKMCAARAPYNHFSRR